MCSIDHAHKERWGHFWERFAAQIAAETRDKKIKKHFHEGKYSNVYEELIEYHSRAETTLMALLRLWFGYVRVQLLNGTLLRM